ncbi:hypothetical protein [uncultured Microbacterium sp.]
MSTQTHGDHDADDDRSGAKDTAADAGSESPEEGEQAKAAADDAVVND